MVDGQVTYWGDERRPQAFIPALICAATLHVLIFTVLSYVPAAPFRPSFDKAITIELIPRDVPAPAATPIATPVTPTVPPQDIVPTPPIAAPQPLPPKPQPSPDSTAEPLVNPAPVTPPQPSTETPPLSSPPITVPAIIAGPQTDEPEEEENAASIYIPSRWALEPALSKPRLEGIFGEGFEKDINCVRSLSDDCTSLRKEVFADYQLSEQDLIWTENFAHSGLTSPELHGLSEREIRKKLAIPIAGDNALVILPGIAIDGNFWDTLHGVNKKCPVLRGIRRCPGLKPKADDKRFNIPKKKTP